MLAILDTSVLIAIEHGEYEFLETIRGVTRDYPSVEPAVTWVNFYEFYFGTLGKSENEAKALEFLEEFSFIGMDEEATKIFSKLRKEKTNVKDFDLLIASIAMANGALLLTRDSDFKRIHGLNCLIL